MATDKPVEMSRNIQLASNDFAKGLSVMIDQMNYSLTVYFVFVLVVVVSLITIYVYLNKWCCFKPCDGRTCFDLKKSYKFVDEDSDDEDEVEDGRVALWLTVKEPSAAVHINYYGEK